MNKILLLLFVIVTAVVAQPYLFKVPKLQTDLFTLPTLPPFVFKVPKLQTDLFTLPTLPPFVFKVPKLQKEFIWNGKVLANDNGKINGLSGTGTWRPPNTKHSFTGTANWQNGKGFGGGVSGSVGVGKGRAVTFGVSGVGSDKPFASIGVRMNIGRRRRNAMARELFHM